MSVINTLYEAFLQSHCVSTDSRHITPGCIFFAFQGEHFDGNAFALDALQQGAAMCVVSESLSDDDRIVKVDNVLATLQELAATYRRSLRIPFVGITGTNGKTTTKELVNAVLSRRYRTAATVGNLNNHLGVPLTLLAIPAEAEMAIVEMGASHPGEIADLCAIADPDCGLITNVGRAHLEGFGSFEGVVRTKTELYRHLANKGGTAFVDADNAELVRRAEEMASLPGVQSALPAYAPATPSLQSADIAHSLGIITYGSAAQGTVDVRGTLTRCAPYVSFYFEVGDAVFTVDTHLLGAYNFCNCMAAVAVGLHFGVEPFYIKEAIEAYIPTNHRSEYRESARHNRLYLDCYNANPSSMAAALTSFVALEADRRVAILGGMKELGAESQTEHRQLVNHLASLSIDECMLVGAEFEGIDLQPNMHLFANTEALRAHLEAHPIEGTTILVKGSNSNRLWTLEEWL